MLGFADGPPRFPRPERRDPESDLPVRFEIDRTDTGRALYVEPDGTLYISRGYDVLRSQDDGRSWTRVSSIPRAPTRGLVERSRLACRLLRHEIKALAKLSDGALIVSTREGVYRAAPGAPCMSPSMVETAGLPLMPPMCLSVGPNDRVIWGEYGSSRKPRAVRVYASDDGGHRFEVAHVFEPGSVLHVHNLLYDGRAGGYWVFAGDHGEHPGIGLLSANLEDFHWVGKGSQGYRAVEAFDFGDRLLYATDTEVEPNALVSMDKATGRIERLMDLEGSCIHACRFGSVYALTTTVEPSPVNRGREAGLWVSRDGDRWQRLFQARKDRWSAVYFQFGSLVLPRGSSRSECILLSGQALEGVDGKLMVGRVH
jgi:hypothetical protein